jgi:hypothetical protein
MSYESLEEFYTSLLGVDESCEVYKIIRDAARHGLAIVDTFT